MTDQTKAHALVTDIELKWNFDDADVRTKTVEKTLAPLVNQVTTLASHRAADRSSKKSKRSRTGAKRAAELVQAVELAIANFIQRGQEIVNDNPDAAEKLGDVLSEVTTSGQDMVDASSTFVQNPCVSDRRVRMVECARRLLTTVTRLLVVADMIDVRRLVQCVDRANNALQDICSAQNQNELQERFNRFRRTMDELNRQTGRRANDLKNTNERDDLHAARAILKTHTPILYSSSKVFVRHPECELSQHNRDFAANEVKNALDAMRDLFEGRRPADGHLAIIHAAVGALMNELDRFTQAVFLDPSVYDKRKNRPDLENQLEQIIKGAAAIADSGHTRDSRKGRIVAECNNLRQALQDLLTEYENNAGRKESSEALDLALVQLTRKSKDIKRNLRRAVVDHISDAFLDTRVPLLLLVEAASRGDVDGTEEAAMVFMEHADKLVDVSKLAVAMSSGNEEGTRIVRYAALVIERLAPQVVNAARLLAQKPNSKMAQENMLQFRATWEERVRVLTMAVDGIISLDDFLAVSEMHVEDDIKACIEAIHNRDGDTLDRTAGAIRGRSLRVCDVVDDEMSLHQGDVYTEDIRIASRRLKKDVLSSFAKCAEKAVNCLNDGQDADVDEFINYASAVHDSIREIRIALLMYRDPQDIDSDEEYEAEGSTGTGHSSQARVQAAQEAQQQDNQRAIMRQLPEEDKRKIQEQIDVFKVVQTKFEREVAKWDETGNDIVTIAKYMCMIMVDMTDFTRGRGPLKTTMDVIGAAQKISREGTKLNALANLIGEECVASETKKDLLAYMQRITLHCHQLNITSKVKADVEQVGDKVIVSGLESAMSLIQTARNLLIAVVFTVKAAYIAATKYPSKSKQSQLFVWKMRAPEKKNLNAPPSVAPKPNGIVRRTSSRRDTVQTNFKQLAEFESA